jgi:hypothetical protein
MTSSIVHEKPVDPRSSHSDALAMVSFLPVSGDGWLHTIRADADRADSTGVEHQHPYRRRPLPAALAARHRTFTATLSVLAVVGIGSLMFNGLDVFGVRLRWVALGCAVAAAAVIRRWIDSLGPGDRQAWMAHTATVIAPDPLLADLTGRFAAIALRSTPREIIRRRVPDFTTIVVDPVGISIPGWALIGPTTSGVHRKSTVQIPWADVVEWHVDDGVDGPAFHRIVRRDATGVQIDRHAVVDNIALLDAVRHFGRQAVTLHVDLEPDTPR